MAKKPFLLIVGPPGAGKGTQAGRIADGFGIPAISTGDIFRANIKDGTDLGLRVKEIIDRGELVPDDLTNEIVADRIAQEDAAEGFLLDGYPRTIAQAETLNEALAARGEKLAGVVLLEADAEEVIQRLLKRAEIEGRADDTEDVIRHRQEVYAAQTKPLIDFYDNHGLLVAVDGLGEIDEVAGRIKSALDSHLA